MSGYERSHVFVRHGERYYDRAADAGITRSFDGRGVVIADFDVDGRPDVLFVAQGGPYFLGRNDFVLARAAPAPHPVFAGVATQQVVGDGAAEFVELELYLKARAAGMPMESPGVRP
jgi:hypothetical protein